MNFLPLSIRFSAAAVFVFMLSAAATHAVTYKWDADGNASAGTPATATPGSGTWNTSSSLWASGTTTTTFVNNNAAQFGGTGAAPGTYAITVDASVTTLNQGTGGFALGFASDGFTLSATSALTIASTGTFSVASGATGTIGTNLTIAATGNLSLENTSASGAGMGTLVLSDNAVVSSTADVSMTSQARMQVNAGAMVTASRFLLAGTATDMAELVINGGTAEFSGATMFAASGANTAGTYTLKSGALTATSATAANGALQFGPSSGSGTATGTFNLDGGILTLSQIKKGGTTGVVTSTFNFNGGTLVVKTGSTLGGTFMQGLTTANVRDGGAVINTNGVTTTIAQNLVHSTIGGDNAVDGGLTKRGAGTLTLTGANTFNGHISIEAGTLSLNSAFIGDTANVYFLTGTILNLNYSGTDTIAGLFFNGSEQAIGTWGSLASSATNKSAFFTGTGILNVTAAAIPEPSTYAALAGTLALTGAALRRRRR